MNCSYKVKQILILKMGCCESKLLGIGVESSCQKYQSNPIQLNQNYVPTKKQLVKINIFDNNKQNIDETSLCSLRSGLENIIYKFQHDKGHLTSTFLDRKAITTQRSKKAIGEFRNPFQNQMDPENQSYIQSEFATRSQLNSEDQQSQSSVGFQNTKILSHASIQTRRQFEKELFYLNSSRFGSVYMLKWVEKDRLPVNFDKTTFQNDVKLFDFYFAAALLQILIYEERNNLKLLAYKNQYNNLGLRLFVNGIKRLIKVKNESNLINLFSWVPNIFSKLAENNTCFWVYLCTGWIPEFINLSCYNNIMEIFRRLIKNFNNINVMIGFTNSSASEYLVMKGVNQQLETVKLSKIVKKQSKNQICQDQQCLWTQISKKYPILYVNWNPFIYSFNKKVQGIFTLQHNSKSRSDVKYLIKVPPSKSEVEVRIFAQIHYTNPLSRVKNYSILLYQCNNYELNFQQHNQPIRCLKSINSVYMSEIFLFQKSSQTNDYIVVFKVNQEEGNQLSGTSVEEDIQISAQFYTFCPIYIKKYKKPQLIAKKQLKAQMVPENAGFGLNSPFFIKNLTFSLSTVPKSICKIRCKAQTTKPLIYQMCILPDNDKTKDITLIKSDQLVKQMIQSDEFHQEGQFQFYPTKENYIVIIVAFIPTEGTLHLTFQNYSTNQTFIDQHFRQNPLAVQKIKCNYEFDKIFYFNWTNQDSGPRKRTKSNSQFIYYPMATFQRYFENPHQTLMLEKGKYQFSIVSKTFAQSIDFNQFFVNQEETTLRVLSAAPPSLSLGIFQINQQKKQAKIVLDDTEYVPYGIGFWTQIFCLQGNYQFVFSKMQQGAQEGIFRIRKIKQF